MLLPALSWSVALRAQRLGIEVTPACPTVFQEFEVAYTADREIESIAPPRWGALTLVRELGRSHGSQLSVVNGVRTNSELFSYRYRVRSRVSGEVFVPGTTAVVGGRECRFERKRITVLPDSAHCEPQCRLEPDSAAMAAMGGCIVRLVCGSQTRQGRSGADAGRYGDLHPVFDRLFRQERAGRVYLPIPDRHMDSSGKHLLTPQLSFGGKPFEVPSYVVWLKGEAGPEGTEPATPGRRRIVYAFAGVLLFCGRRFSCAIMHPPQAVTPSFPASRGRCISSWRPPCSLSGFAACSSAVPSGRREHPGCRFTA